MGHIVDFCVESGVLTVKGEEDELYIGVGAVSFGKSVIIYPSEEEKQAAKDALLAEKAKLQKQKEQAQSGITGLSSMANQDTSQLEGGAN